MPLSARNFSEVNRCVGSHKFEANGSDFSTMPSGMKLCTPERLTENLVGNTGNAQMRRDR